MAWMPRNLGVRLRLFQPVFFPQGQAVSVSVLNQDGSVATSVSSFPAEVELQADLEFVIPIQVFCGSASACTTLFVPLTEVMRHCGHMPVFCTLWLGVAAASEQPAYHGNACAIEQHFEKLLNLGKELTHPKVGVGVRLTNAASATPKEHLGLFRVVDMYEDLLAHIYIRTHDHLGFDMAQRSGSKSPRNAGPDLLKQALEGDPCKKMDRLLQLLAQKQKKITQLQAEVQKLKVPSKDPKNRQASCKEMYEKASANSTGLKDKRLGSPRTHNTTSQNEGLPVVVEACSKCIELEETRYKCQQLELELENSQDAARNQMEMQTKKFVQSMREIQGKAGVYEEEMKKRDEEIAELRSELEQARLEADDFREMYDLQRETNEKEFEEEMRRRDQQHELLVNELKQVREQYEALLASRETARAETPVHERGDIQSVRSAAPLGTNGSVVETASRHRTVTIGAGVDQYSSSRSQTTLASRMANSKQRAMTDLAVSNWEQQALQAPLENSPDRRGFAAPPEGYSL